MKSRCSQVPRGPFPAQGIVGERGERKREKSPLSFGHG